MSFISRRRIIVTACFTIWIGTAGFICWAVMGQPMETSADTINPSQVVHATPINRAASVALAAR